MHTPHHSENAMMGCKRGGCSTVDHEFAKCHRNRKYHRNEAEKVVGEGLDLPPLAKHEPIIASRAIELDNQTSFPDEDAGSISPDFESK